MAEKDSQKSDSKIRIKEWRTNHYLPDSITLIAYSENIGKTIAENVKYKMTSLTKNISLKKIGSDRTAILPHQTNQFIETLFIKEGEKCKIKLEVSWKDSALKKRVNFTQTVICNRRKIDKISIKKI